MQGRRWSWLATALLLALVATGVEPSAESARADDPKIPLVAIDPGHGGADYGATGSVDGRRLLEKELTLRVSRALADQLQKAGYRTLLTRSDDRSVGTDDRNGDGKVDAADDLQARVDRANQAGATILVSVHFNGSVDRSLRGPEVYYSPDRPFAAESRKLAERIAAATTARLAEAKRPVALRGVFSDTILGGHLYVLGPAGGRIVRASNMPGVLVEGMFLSNDADARLLADDATVQALVKGYADGIAAYLGPPPPPPPKQARVAGRTGAYLRPAPLLGTKPLTTLPNGATVDLAEPARGDAVGSAADWWRVDFKGQAGYIFARLLQPVAGVGATTTPSPTPTKAPTAEPTPPAARSDDAAPTRRGTITTDDNLPARLRARPTRQSTILARVRAGDTVSLLGETTGEAVDGGSNRWLKVRHGDLVGWIWAPLID
jgi:N-acetylmuramoyl-L-alanine amidase